MGTQATIMVAASDMSGASIKKYVTAGFISSPKPTLQFAEQRGNLLSDAQEGVSIRKWAAEDCLKNCYNATIELDFNRDIVDVIEYPKFVKEAAALGEKLTQLNEDKRLKSFMKKRIAENRDEIAVFEARLLTLQDQ